MSNGTKVVKRNGKTEPLDLNKLHVMVEEACKDLANVSASQVEMQSGIQFYDGITTAEIQEILIRSASDLIDLDHPNYQFVAARLLLFALRKQLFGRMHECPTVKQHVERCVGRGVYDSEILTMYSDEEFDKLESFVDHSRDYLFTYAGLRQVVDKYLVQDRSTVDNTLAVSLLMLMTPSIVSLLAIWLLADMLHKGRVSVSMQVASVASTAKSVVEKYNTQALSPSLKSLRQLYDAALKTGSEVVQLQSTFLSGTKK